jgi:hypothetical protein
MTLVDFRLKAFLKLAMKLMTARFHFLFNKDEGREI